MPDGAVAASAGYASGRPRLAAAGFGVALAGLFALAFAWFVQDGLGIVPCELCLLERWPFRALVVLGLLVTLAGKGARPALALAAFVTAVSAILAGLHVGVEQHTWPSPFPSCRAPAFRPGSIAEQLAAMPLRPQKPCDAPTDLVPGVPVSMAAMNLIFSLSLLCALAIFLVRNARGALR